MSRSTREKDWLARVQAQGCVLCWHLDLGETEAEIHHLREGQGMSQRANDYLVIPLCREHHRGSRGLHGLGKGGFYQTYVLDELDLLSMTLSRIS